VNVPAAVDNAAVGCHVPHCRAQGGRGHADVSRTATAGQAADGWRVDRRVGVRVRERRVLLGLSRRRLADLVGVAYQQAHKCERGINRVSAGRLFAIAGALGVELAHFYEGLGGGPVAPARDRRVLELARDFAAIRGPRTRAALCELARVMAGGGPDAGEGRVNRGRAP
jgi:transcriptional regulator with XRE-family HTH domain